MQNKNPLVTVILPVYNGEKTIEATLKSLLAQTFTNFELLIGIDGTKDGSKQIVKSFNDERIQIDENPVNLGLGPNVNKLISLANTSSKYIAMAEQDDVYVSNRLKWQVEVMEKNAAIGLVSGIAEFVTDTKKTQFPGLLIRGEQFPQGAELFKFLYINQLKVVNTCMLIRKSVHQQNKLKFTNKYPNMNVDWDYVLRFSLISKVYGIPKVLVAMNRRSKNQSVTTNKWKQFETSRRLILDFKKEFPKLIDNGTYNKALKMCRKVELGHHSKFGILFYSIVYFLRYFDSGFLKYLNNKIRLYKKNNF